MGYDYYEPTLQTKTVTDEPKPETDTAKSADIGVSVPTDQGSTGESEQTDVPAEQPIATTNTPNYQPRDISSSVVAPVTTETKTVAQPVVNEPGTADKPSQTETPLEHQTSSTPREQIIDKLGLKNAPEEQKKQVLNSINGQAAAAAIKAVIENATPELARKIQDSVGSNDKIIQLVTDDSDLQDQIEQLIDTIWKKIPPKKAEEPTEE